MKPSVPYGVHNIPPHAPVMSQLNPVQNDFCKVHFKYVLFLYLRHFSETKPRSERHSVLR
jgi:hypothetical protein